VVLSVSIDLNQTIIIEFELQAKQQLMFQALLQGEDGLGLVRCVDGIQQLWTTTGQFERLQVWLAALPENLQVHQLRSYTWSGASV